MLQQRPHSRAYTFLHIGLISILFISISACASTDGIQAPKLPIRLPFFTEKAGNKAESIFQVSKKEIYAFELNYGFGKGARLSRETTWLIVGGSRQDGAGRWVEPGAPVIIHIKVNGLDSNNRYVAIEKTITNPTISSFGATDLYANLFIAPLLPGHYKVIAESSIDAPEMKDVKTDLYIVKAYLGK